MPFPGSRVIPVGWAQHHQSVDEGAFLEMLRIRHRAPATEQPFDPELGYEPSTPSPWFYDGPGRIEPRAVQSGNQTAGEQVITVLGYVVAVPREVTECRPTDIVEVYGSNDPVNVGKTVTLVDVQSSSFATERRMSAVDYQEQGAP